MAVNYYIRLFHTDTEVYSGILMSVLLLVAEAIKNWWVEIILFQKISLICYKITWTWSPSSEWCSVLPSSFLLLSWKEYTHACFNKRKKKISRLIVTIQIALELFHEILKMKQFTSTLIGRNLEIVWSGNDDEPLRNPWNELSDSSKTKKVLA